MAPGATVILLLWLMGVKNIIATAHTAADIYRDLRLIHFLQRHCLRAFTCITERAERSFFGSSQLYSPDLALGKRNHFTIYNALPAQMRCNDNDNVDDNCAAELLCSNDNVDADARGASVATAAGLSAQRSVACNSYENFCSQLTAHSQQPRAKSQEPNTKLTLGVVSRLERIKGMDLVVPAFAEVLKAYPETQLLVVGDGTLRASMEEQAAQLGCADHIRFVGRQPQEELSQWYSQMDIVLMPSRSEGFGLTAIEAMAHGCVMVASDVGGLPEVVRDGICGLLHRTEDVADMASKICSLIGDNDLYNKLRAQSLVEVEKYSFERYAVLMNDLYNKLGR